MPKIDPPDLSAITRIVAVLASWALSMNQMSMLIVGIAVVLSSVRFVWSATLCTVRALCSEGQVPELMFCNFSCRWSLMQCSSTCTSLWSSGPRNRLTAAGSQWFVNLRYASNT